MTQKTLAWPFNFKTIRSQLGQFILEMKIWTLETNKELITSKLDAVLEELGLTKESFDGSVKDYRLSGAYRKLFVKPNGITGRVVEYSDSEENLIESEKDTLDGMPKTNEDEKKSDGTKMNGIIVKFTLPTSAYATMALREFMHKNETE